ncbi:unnamed protein product [Durusdinium trenchii]|uniref:Uncharacterized protein n=1 Tax=Durusdinium trenchii TaxID=1381693 RepID=A0ABP0HPC5_9DINO
MPWRVVQDDPMSAAPEGLADEVGVEANDTRGSGSGSTSSTSSDSSSLSSSSPDSTPSNMEQAEAAEETRPPPPQASRGSKRKDIQLTEAWEAAATGPSVLTELFQWPEHATATLWAQRGEGGTTAAAVAMDNLTKFHSLQLIMTSDFSGMGTAELAVEMALDAVAQHLHARLPNGSEIGGGSGPVFTPLAACDISSVCRGFMQAHCNSPAHIFEDLFARLSKKAQDDIALSEKLTADTLVDMKNKDKEVLQLYGDNLLSEYMSAQHDRVCPLPHVELPAATQKAQAKSKFVLSFNEAAVKQRLSKQYKKGMLTTECFNLLPAAKQKRVTAYKISRPSTQQAAVHEGQCCRWL